MEEKVVCYYCGTVFPLADQKCPLCGGTRHTEYQQVPQRRERAQELQRREQERETPRPKRKAGGGKFAAAKKSSGRAPKGVLIAALILLALAVVFVTWFIGDMIGWWGGMEDDVERESLPTVQVNEECTFLHAEPARLDFTELGETLYLTVSVNPECREVLYCTSSDSKIVFVSEEGVTAEGIEEKSVTFTLTALAEGETTVEIVCGKKNQSCPVTVCKLTPEQTEPTQPAQPGVDPDFIPELNRMEVTFEEAEATVTLKVTNLPEGAEVIWRSSDETIVTVDADGVLTAVNGGEATVVAEVNGKQTEVKVICEFATANNNDGAHLERTDVTVEVGDEFPLYLYNSESEHIDDIVYEVDDESVCKVEDNYVIVVGAGTTKVRVIYNGEEYVCIVRASW